MIFISAMRSDLSSAAFRSGLSKTRPSVSRRQSSATTRTNVQRICADARASGAQVLLVAVPELSLMAAAGRLSDHALYEEVAEELKIPLHSKGWSGVLAQDRLRSDQIHANAAGYEQFAQGLVETLKATELLLQ